MKDPLEKKKVGLSQDNELEKPSNEEKEKTEKEKKKASLKFQVDGNRKERLRLSKKIII